MVYGPFGPECSPPMRMPLHAPEGPPMWIQTLYVGMAISLPGIRFGDPNTLRMNRGVAVGNFIFGPQTIRRTRDPKTILRRV